MTRIEIRKAKQKDPVFFYVLVNGKRGDYAIYLEQESSLRYLVDFIAITQDNTPGDEECEIVCEREELKDKIAEMYNDLGRDEAELEGVSEEIKTRIYKIREDKERIAQTGLITVEVAEDERHVMKV